MLKKYNTSNPKYLATKELYLQFGKNTFTASDLPSHSHYARILANLANDGYLVRVPNRDGNHRVPTYRIGLLYIKQFTVGEEIRNDPDIVRKIEDGTYTYMQLSRDTGFSEHWWRRYVKAKRDETVLEVDLEIS